jgi:drug/metabolite transporter (DMT)-like permease
MPYLGEILAATAPIAWAIAVILFRKGGEDVAPLALNLFKSVLGLVLIALTLLAVGGAPWTETTVADGLMLAASGVVGIAVADTIFFHALNTLGASRLAVLGAAYPLMVIALSFVFLDEGFGIGQWAGAGLVVIAVILASLPDKGDQRVASFTHGILLGLAALAVMAVGVVMAKPALDRTPLVWAAFLRLGGGVAFMVPVCLLLPSRRALWAPFRPSETWKVIVPGAVMGTYLAYMMWFGGNKYAPVSVASTLNQLHVIYTVILAALFLGERLTAARVAGVVFGVSGSVLVVLG